MPDPHTSVLDFVFVLKKLVLWNFNAPWIYYFHSEEKQQNLNLIILVATNVEFFHAQVIVAYSSKN